MIIFLVLSGSKYPNKEHALKAITAIPVVETIDVCVCVKFCCLRVCVRVFSGFGEFN